MSGSESEFQEYVVSFRVIWFVFLLKPSPAHYSGMAATNTVDDTAIPPDNWGPQDESALGPGNNGLAGSGVALPVDDRGAPQDPENPEYPRGSSVSENDTYREKQVKVLRFFLVRLASSLGAIFGHGNILVGNPLLLLCATISLLTSCTGLVFTFYCAAE